MCVCVCVCACVCVSTCVYMKSYGRQSPIVNT